MEQAHARGLELHAWLNPYRVSMDMGPDTVRMLSGMPGDSPPSIYRARPDWIRTAARRFVLDPGLPEVRAWLGSVVAEITSRYAVDAIHFDDYFYYETADSRLDDAQTFATYGRGFADKGDWRRHSTRLLVQGLSEQLRATSPGVRFGVSPAGVWRNRADDPRGSDTQAGAPSYDAAFADTRQWVLDGLVDDIVPQVYWPFARQAVGYGTIARWWADVALASPGVQLHIGMALYKAGRPTAQEPDLGRGGRGAGNPPPDRPQRIHARHPRQRAVPPRLPAGSRGRGRRGLPAAALGARALRPPPAGAGAALNRAAAAPGAWMPGEGCRPRPAFHPAAGSWPRCRPVPGRAGSGAAAAAAISSTRAALCWVERSMSFTASLIWPTPWLCSWLAAVISPPAATAPRSTAPRSTWSGRRGPPARCLRPRGPCWRRPGP